jgi:hypothetical protein
MQINLLFNKDEWGRASLTGTIAVSEPCHTLIYAAYKSDVWWAKSANALSEISYSALYHHVHDGEKRQVIVNCGVTLQNFVMPSGYDPLHSCVVDITLLTPNTLYACREHELGIILLPKSATKSMRNKIWKLKDAFMTDALLPFTDELSHGRTGHRTK